jgi:hypothetical protein
MQEGEYVKPQWERKQVNVRMNISKKTMLFIILAYLVWI